MGHNIFKKETHTINSGRQINGHKIDFETKRRNKVSLIKFIKNNSVRFLRNLDNEGRVY